MVRGGVRARSWGSGCRGSGPGGRTLGSPTCRGSCWRVSGRRDDVYWMLCRTFTGSLLPTSPAQPASCRFPAQLEALHTPCCLCVLCSWTTIAVARRLHTTSALPRGALSPSASWLGVRAEGSLQSRVLAHKLLRKP